MSAVIEKKQMKNGVLILTMNRPQVLNAMNKDLIVGLLDTFKEIENEKESRVVVLTGKGKGFCSGADLANGGWEIERELTRGEAGAHRIDKVFNPLVRLIASIDKPIITAINGLAAGGGVGLALAGDLVVASASARFKLVFGPNLGIIPDVGASWFLPNMVGRARANGIAMLGDDLSATDAKDWGLIWDCFPENQFMEKTIELADRLADGAIKGLKEISKAHSNALVNSLDQHLDYERDIQKILVDRPEFKEGVSAFLEKRKPNFRKNLQNNFNFHR